MPEKVAYIKDYRMDGVEIHDEMEPSSGGGFVKLFRKISEWEWYTDSQAVHLFIHILLHANHKPKKWQGETVQRGEMITSVAKLSEATGISAKAVRTRLKKFEKSGEISRKTANKFTKISICNYGEYQAVKTDEGQTKGKQRANKGQTKGNKQECKEGKEGKERTYTPNSGECGAAKNDVDDWRAKYDQEVLAFVQRFQAHRIKHGGNKAPKITESLLRNGADTVDKLIRIDGHSLQEIKAVLKWAVNDNFWSGNVFSLAGLREKKGDDGRTKYQKILAASERTVKSTRSMPDLTAMSRPEQDEYFRNLAAEVERGAN